MSTGWPPYTATRISSSHGYPLNQINEAKHVLAEQFIVGRGKTLRNIQAKIDQLQPRYITHSELGLAEQLFTD